MSSNQQNINAALGEVLSQHKKDFQETSDTLKKALVKKRKQQEKELKMHAEIGKSLEVIQSLTSDARSQRRDDVKEEQHRAVAFVREILTQVRTGKRTREQEVDGVLMNGRTQGMTEEE